MKVVFSFEAERDLQAIGDHIAQDNPSRARTFTRKLATKAIELGGMPHAFPLARGLEHLDVRRRHFQNHLIFYRVEATRVLIVHILHGARDYEALLAPADDG